MNSMQMQALARDIRDALRDHVPGIWPGFGPRPFILYDDENQVACGERDWPARYARSGELWLAHGQDRALMGNTSLEYGGAQTAIWDVRCWDDARMSASKAALLAHEMFHAHQRERDLPTSNELLLPFYPHSARTVALSLMAARAASEWRLGLSREEARALLARLIDCADAREGEVGEIYAAYDAGLWSNEGTAAYVECRVCRAISNRPLAECAQKHLARLSNTTDEVLTAYRARGYSIGMAACFLMDDALGDWQAAWERGGKALLPFAREALGIAPREVPLSPEQLAEGEARIEAHARQARERIDGVLCSGGARAVIEGDMALLGFNPMGIVRDGARMLHDLAQLRLGGEVHLWMHEFIAEVGEGGPLDVRRITISARNVRAEDGAVYIDDLPPIRAMAEAQGDVWRVRV